MRSNLAFTKIRIAATAALFVSFTLLAQAQVDRKATPGNGPYGAPEATFLSHHLGNDHAEGISTMDMNGDGLPDLVSGAYWYENPGVKNGGAAGEWKRHQFRKVGIMGEFVSDCGEWVVDVNHDGAPDIVTTGWMVNGVWWYENPKKDGVLWQAHFITDSFDTEGGVFADINGDGVPDLALAHYNHSGVLWIDFAGAAPHVHHVGGKEQDGHGIGVADIDGDGSPDILTPNGWFKNVNANHDEWEWHGDWHMDDAGFPILGYDVNNDGKMDIIFGQGHSYGLYWLQQVDTGENRHWVRQTIDESYSQIHALKLADIDGDGQMELIAGKRYRGHNGGDPGSYDPLVIYYYKIDPNAQGKPKFTRYDISVNGTAGAGTQFIAADLDGDGDVDLAVAGKTGVHLLENLMVNKVPKEQREKQILLNQQWPFPDEGDIVQQQDGPTPK